MLRTSVPSERVRAGIAKEKGEQNQKDDREKVPGIFHNVNGGGVQMAIALTVKVGNAIGMIDDERLPRTEEEMKKNWDAVQKQCNDMYCTNRALREALLKKSE